eukprot:3594866-Amphidinium_carterae.1
MCALRRNRVKRRQRVGEYVVKVPRSKAVSTVPLECRKSLQRHGTLVALTRIEAVAVLGQGKVNRETPHSNRAVQPRFQFQAHEGWMQLHSHTSKSGSAAQADNAVNVHVHHIACANALMWGVKEYSCCYRGLLGNSYHYTRAVFISQFPAAGGGIATKVTKLIRRSRIPVMMPFGEPKTWAKRCPPEFKICA